MTSGEVGLANVSANSLCRCASSVALGVGTPSSVEMQRVSVIPAKYGSFAGAMRVRRVHFDKEGMVLGNTRRQSVGLGCSQVDRVNSVFR